MEKKLLIVNPVSGKGRVKNILLELLSTLCSGGSAVTVCVTETARRSAAWSAPAATAPSTRSSPALCV